VRPDEMLPPDVAFEDVPRAFTGVYEFPGLEPDTLYTIAQAALIAFASVLPSSPSRSPSRAGGPSPAPRPGRALQRGPAAGRAGWPLARGGLPVAWGGRPEGTAPGGRTRPVEKAVVLPILLMLRPLCPSGYATPSPP